MAIKKLVFSPNEILNQEADNVTHFDKKLKKLLEDLEETMLLHDGMGLAAPQIGISQKVAVVNLEQDGVLHLINPRVVWQSPTTNLDIEGCLSIPDTWGEVARPDSIKVECQDVKGRDIEFTTKDPLLARVILHEIDHLYGELFTNKVTKYFTTDEEMEAYYNE